MRLFYIDEVDSKPPCTFLPSLSWDRMSRVRDLIILGVACIRLFCFMSHARRLDWLANPKFLEGANY